MQFNVFSLLNQLIQMDLNGLRWFRLSKHTMKLISIITEQCGYIIIFEGRKTEKEKSIYFNSISALLNTILNFLPILHIVVSVVFVPEIKKRVR